MSDYSVALGGRLHEARTTAHLTQADIATALNTTQATVSRWESGARSVDAEELVALAYTLHADPAWLLTGTTTPTAAKAHRIRSAVRALDGVAAILSDLLENRI